MKAQKLRASLVKLAMLLSDGEYHDGTALGKKLGITRSAIWKSLQKLQQYGVPIKSIKGKGYSLAEPLILLNSSAIKQAIHDKAISLEIFETISSTNDYLKAFWGSKKVHVCISELQIAGKGRLHREWHSPFAQNIYFSCLYSFHKDIHELAGLSLIVSLAIIHSLKAFKLNAMVKWPNDILCIDKKLSGSLIEVQAESHGVSSAIIGIGINVNMLEDPSVKISQPWVSLRELTQHYIDRNEIVSALINSLMDYLTRFSEQGLRAFIDEWASVDYLLNKKITLKNLDKTIEGTASGIDAHGNLLLKLPDQSIKAFSSGDTTIMKKR